MLEIQIPWKYNFCGLASLIFIIKLIIHDLHYTASFSSDGFLWIVIAKTFLLFHSTILNYKVVWNLSSWQHFPVSRHHPNYRKNNVILYIRHCCHFTNIRWQFPFFVHVTHYTFVEKSWEFIHNDGIDTMEA